MEKENCHELNDKQGEFVSNNDTLSHIGARNIDDHTVQVYPESACCSRRTDDPDTIIDEKAVNRHTYSSLRRFRDRFINEDVNISQQMLTSTQDTDDVPPYGWVDGYQGIETNERDRFISKIIHVQMMRYCIRKLQVIETKLDVQTLIRSSINRDIGDQMKLEVNERLRNFEKTDNIDHLLFVYTLNSQFYGDLQNRVDSFAILIYKNLSVLKDRAFKGICYRGISMTEKDVKDYQWAQTSKNRIIEIRAMSSTSIDDEVAKLFFQRDPQKPISAIFVYHFPVECPTALKLYEIREKSLSCISRFPDEKEVLLLPGTLFEVEDVYQTDGKYKIELTNIHVPFDVIRSAIQKYDEA